MANRNTGAEILNIRPDADMGLGQNTNIPVPAVELDQVNKAAQDIRLYDHQRQLMKYEHDLKQQDNLLKGLTEDAVPVGTILPEDMDYFNAAEAEDRKAFLAVKTMEPDQNGQNREYDDYVRKHQRLKDTAAMLQARYVAIEKLRQQRAEAILPEEQKALDEHIAREIARPKGDPIRPFQKAFSMDLDKMVSNAQNGALLKAGEPANIPSTTTKTTTGPKGTTVQTTTGPVPGSTDKGKNKTVPITGEITGLDAEGYLPIIITEPDQKWDYRTMLRNTTKEYVSDEAGRVNQQRIYDTFQGATSDIPKRVLEEWNKRLVGHDKANGIPSIKTPGPPGPPNPDNPNDVTGREIDTGEYPNAINYRLVGNRVIIEDDVPTFNAKVALANVKGDYVIKGKKSFDEGAFKLNLEKAKNKAEVLALGAKAQADRARAGYYFAKAGEIKDKDQQEKAINDGWTLNLTSQKKLTEKSTDGSMTLAKLPNTETTPIFGWSDGDATKPVIIKPIGAKTIYGSDPQNPATYGKPVGYEGGYYEQEYTRGGYPVSPEQLSKIYQKYSEDENAKGKEPVPMDDFLKMAIKEGKVDVKIRGERGSTTRLFHTQAFKKAIGSSKNYTNFIQEEDQQ